MCADSAPDPGRPSAFFERHRDAIVATAPLGPALDLACGRGRHALALARRGVPVVAVDRSAEHLAHVDRSAATARERGERIAPIRLVEADLESTRRPDLERASFGVVLVFRYLHRPILAWIADLVAPGGLLVYETFTTAQRRLGWGPRRDAFLLEPGELGGAFPGLEVLAYEEGPSDEPRPAETARLLARRPSGT